MLMRDYDPIAFCCQETYMKSPSVIKFRKYSSYHIFYEAIDTRASGGVTIMIKKSIPHRQISLNTNLQAVAVTLSLHKTMTLCSIYIPPSYPLGGNELDELISQLPSPFILIGDMNAHSTIWGNTQNNNKGNTLEKFIEHNELCLWNDNTHTYIHPATGSSSAIDLSLCSPSLFLDFEWSVHEDLCGSDHFPTFLHYKNKAALLNIPKWSFKKADWYNFKFKCSQEINRNTFKTIKENRCELFTSVLHFIAEITIPKSSTVPRKLHKPWWNGECEEALKQRKRALNHFKRNPSHENLTNYKIEYARARRVIRRNMRNSWREYVSQLNNRTPVNTIWKIIKKISGKVQGPPIKQLEKNGSIISNPKEIGNTLAETIAHNSSAENYTNKFRRKKMTLEQNPINFTSKNDEIYNKKFSIRELLDSLKKAHDTAVGPDDIHYQILKQMPENSLEVLLDIYNDIWSGGDFPSQWREATIIPIPKAGKNLSDPGNYRPIALTSCICKTFERMVNTRLVWYLEYHAILTAHQSGFRKRRSTTDQLIKLETIIREGFMKGQHTVGIFFDLEKAYDTTWKYGILKDLYNAGLRGNMPKFISKFLTGRNFTVRVGNTLSDSYHQQEGVPQGSILSVTLFSMKINNIVKCLLNGVNCSLYVDDFLISYQSKNMNSIERILQLCLNKLENWADENGFKFSRSKTVCVHFCQQRKFHPDPTLKLYGVDIPVLKEIKFLGVIFDSKLSFIPHINYMKAKCNKSLNLLKVVSRFDWGADRTTLLRLYRAVIRSQLDYGSIVWGSARKSYIKILDPIHHQGLRIATGAFRTSPVESLYVESNEESLYRRRERLSLQYALQLGSSPANPTFDMVFNPKLQDNFLLRPKTIPTFGIRIRSLREDLEIEPCQIENIRLPHIPIWDMMEPTILYGLRAGKKSDVCPSEFQSRFHIIQNKYDDHQFIYTDGSKEGDRVGCAVVCGRQCVMERLPDVASIYTAELRAIYLALHHGISSTGDKLIICVDSLSCLQAIENLEIENPLVLSILELHSTFKTLKKDVVFCWVPSHVGIRGNELADKAAKTALKGRKINIPLPFTDFRPIIKQYVRKQWSDFWSLQSENKLHAVQPALGCSMWSCRERRREEIVLCRLRIGHSFLTHRYLLAGEDPPECISCQERLTVDHILLHCSEYHHIRVNYYHAETRKELLDNITPDTILNFLREAGLFFLI